MGFGSYDESEQQNQAVNTEEDDVEVDEHGEGQDGEFTFEMDGSADDMLDQLQDIKESAEPEDED